MSDTWSGMHDAIGERQSEPATTSRPRQLLNIVEENLRTELNRRRGRKPHAQLSVSRAADPTQINAAHARLRKQYDPRCFQPFGPESVALSGQILDLISEAREQLLLERGDPTEPTLESLQRDSARRRSEALKRAPMPPWWQRILAGWKRRG